MNRWYGKPIKKALLILRAKNKCPWKKNKTFWSNAEDDLMILYTKVCKVRWEINQLHRWVTQR